MSSSKKISLLSAIFINLNVMIGTGLFINTYNLSAKSGAAGFLLYPLIGMCMLPLISVIGKLVKYYPTDGLYGFAQNYHPYLGFLSCWSYFFGKLASSCVMLTVATTMLQQLIPSLKIVSPISMNLIVLAIFTTLNLQNMKVGIIIQSFFLTSKSIPIFFAIIAGVFLFNTATITADQFIWSGMPMSIPLVLYCLAGFETACALGRNIENPSINGPKAVYYSFGIIMLLYGVFQGCVYMTTHQFLGALNGYEGIFPTISHNLFNSELIAHKMSILLSFAIGSSALGGAYGILFANSWNLYTLAENNLVFQSSAIMKLNKHQTPWIAVLIEAFVCTLFLICNQKSHIPLQLTATLGIVIAYTVSAFAYFQLLKKFNAPRKEFFVSYAAFVTCMLFIVSCAFKFIETGIVPLFVFIAILLVGTAMFIYQQK